MKHFYSKLAAVSLSALVLTTSASALSHTVVRGDTMWKLAVQYQVCLLYTSPSPRDCS